MAVVVVVVDDVVQLLLLMLAAWPNWAIACAALYRRTKLMD